MLNRESIRNLPWCVRETVAKKKVERIELFFC